MMMDDVYGGGSILSFTKIPCTPVSGPFANYFDVFGDVDQQQRLGTGSSVTSSSDSISEEGRGGDDGDSVNDLSVVARKNSPAFSTSTSCTHKASSASSSSLLLASPQFLCKSCAKRQRTGGSVKTSDKNKEKINYSGFGANSSIQRDPYIVFLQKKQVEILGELHQEIRMLKHENAELKFQIHVILQQHDPDDAKKERVCSYRGKNINSPNTNDNAESRGGMTIGGDSCCVGDREKMLELELESATKMIQELKWVQQHYENKIRMQETKIDGMMRQLYISSNSGNAVNLKALPIQCQPTMLVHQIAKMESNQEANRPPQSGRHRSSPVCQATGPVTRRNSIQSILPSDYKEQVATLPPIIANQLENPSNYLSSPNTLFKNLSSSRSASKHFENNNMVSKNDRRSSMSKNNNKPSVRHDDGLLPRE